MLDSATVSTHVLGVHSICALKIVMQKSLDYSKLNVLLLYTIPRYQAFFRSSCKVFVMIMGILN